MKVFLVLPPHWTPAMPHLALPVLTAYLRSRGVQVIQRDLNLETYDAVLSRAYLDQVVERLHAQFNKAWRGKLPIKIKFADEAIPPRTLRLLSAQLTAQGSPVDWCGAVRFERALSKSLLEAVSRGGGRMLFFGLETASERMIEHMVKGTQRETMSRILKESAQAGIWNHTFYFFGFPTETTKDAQDTIDFLYAHQASIHSASPGEFVLERYSPVYLDPARFGVRRILEKPGRDLAVHFDYKVESGIDAATAHTIGKRLLDALPTKRFFQFYVHDAYRFLYASHLHAQGQALPLWLANKGAGPAQD